jgi:hypothetical protein
VLFDVLGEDFAGVLGFDCFSAYRKYMKNCNILVQFCLAHLIWELKYLTTLSDKPTVAYGEKLIKALREMFGIFHQRNQITEQAFVEAMNNSRDRFLADALTDVPQTRQSQNLANRFRKYGDAYFRFITTPDIEPTNNLVEQAIRFLVIDRQLPKALVAKEAELGANAFGLFWLLVLSRAAPHLILYMNLYKLISATNLLHHYWVTHDSYPVNGYNKTNF